MALQMLQFSQIYGMAGEEHFLLREDEMVMESGKNTHHKKRVIAVLMLMAVLVLAAVLCIIVRFKDTRYYITQYADATGLQAMFYTIESNRGHLIIIDGGNVGNEDYLKQIIDEKGGHIDAWILTHPHPDHVGAFNELWDEIKDEVDVVYTIDMDYDAYREKAQEWDGFEEYERFLKHMEGFDGLCLLYAGDEIEICGLQCKVFHAYDNWVNQISRDLCNDGSMMFRIANKEESMLFCADIGRGMSDRIIQEYGEELKCSYIQMGHHGNGGLSEEFYRLTEPQAAFFDAPEWLMNPAEGANYTTPENRKIMESMGAKIFYYTTAPNRIELN